LFVSEGFPQQGAVESIQEERSGVLAASPGTNHLIQRLNISTVTAFLYQEYEAIQLPLHGAPHSLALFT